MLAAANFAGAADIKAPVYKAPPIMAPAPTWAGFYAGLNAGYGWGSGSTDLVALEPNFFIRGQTIGALPTSLGPRMEGFIGGGQIGYNFRFDRTILGLEADIAYSGMKGTAAYSSNVSPPVLPPMTTTQTNKVTWLGTVRSRLGWLWTPSVLVYASGGLAYGGVKASTNVNVDLAANCPASNVLCSTGSLSDARIGWAVGGGIEALIGINWTARIDYLYFDLGSESYPVVSTATFGFGGTEVMRPNAKFNGHIVRVGLNYRFGGR
ncbi:MAG TPA: outer membrane beta-barrel protein [Pseudolabrys sp.]|nr:outer membrane beta-barrel protein [Pseudolabrys sp.]